MPEVLERRQHRGDRGVAERAERLAGDVAGNARQQIEIAHLPFATLDPGQNLVEPVGAFAARRALAARLVPVEVQEVLRQPHHAGRIVEHDDAGGPEQRSGFLHAVEAGLGVELIGQQERDRRTTRDDRLQRTPLTDAARVPFDELAKRHVHRCFVDARTLHVPADTVQLRPAVLLRPERGKPLRAVLHNQRHVGERLDVVHRGGTVVEPDERGKRRLVARLGALAFERLEQRGLFAGFVRAGAAVHVHVAVEPGAENVLAQEPVGIGFVDGPFEHVLHMEELAANIDVGDLRSDGVAGNRASFDQQVRIPLHQEVVLERSRLAFVGVAGDVLRPGRLLVDELPFHARREPGAAPTAKPRGLHHLDDLVGSQGERLLQSLHTPRASGRSRA